MMIHGILKRSFKKSRRISNCTDADMISDIDNDLDYTEEDAFKMIPPFVGNNSKIKWTPPKINSPARKRKIQKKNRFRGQYLLQKHHLLKEICY